MAEASLRDAFIGALSDPRRAEEASAHPGLDDHLRRWLDAARETWAPVALGDERFVAHVALHLRSDGPLAAALSEIRATDLYIACACALGDNAAITVFERNYFGELEALWPSYRDRVSLDDARQMLRQKLFTRTETDEPKIVKFAGRGDIRGWVRVVAARMLADLTDKQQRERPVDEAFFDKLGTGVDLELDRFKAQYGVEFREAFRVAVDSLTPRERSLLRHAYVRDASVVEIGGVYGVHGATAARWVASARQNLVRALRKTFAERLQVTNAELESVLRMIESTVHVTLERLLEEQEDAR
jgi:RNA polymerase sigma-70 factor (ECF subfamily)